MHLSSELQCQDQFQSSTNYTQRWIIICPFQLGPFTDRPEHVIRTRNLFLRETKSWAPILVWCMYFYLWRLHLDLSFIGNYNICHKLFLNISRIFLQIRNSSFFKPLHLLWMNFKTFPRNHNRKVKKRILSLVIE